MTAEEYRAAVTLAVAAARVLAEQPIPELLREIERSHALGPILDPTLYREKHRAMDEDAEVLRAALPLYQLGKRLAAASSAAGASA